MFQPIQLSEEEILLQRVSAELGEIESDEGQAQTEGDEWSDELEYLLSQQLNDMEVYDALSGGY